MPGVADGAAYDVTVWGDGLIAVGQRETGKQRRLSGVVWASKSGAEWSEPLAIRDAVFHDVIATTSGLVIVGFRTTKDEDRHVPTVWSSSDGLDWAPTQLSEATGLVFDSAVDRSPAGVWLAQALLMTADRDLESRLWRSEDGIAWEPSELPMDGLTISDVVWTPHGFLMAQSEVFNVPDAGGLLWGSPDGTSWQQLAETENIITSLGVGPSGYLAFTAPRLDPRTFRPAEGIGSILLTSPDGLSWSEHQMEPLDPAFVSAVTVAPDGRLLVAGAIPGDDILSWHPTIWVGQPTD